MEYSVRYHWKDRSPEGDGDSPHVLTSGDTRHRSHSKVVHGPESGARYHFRGQGTSQWLRIREGDLEAFRDADRFEVRRE